MVIVVELGNCCCIRSIADIMESIQSCTSILFAAGGGATDPLHCPIKSFITSSQLVLAVGGVVVLIDAGYAVDVFIPPITWDIKSFQLWVLLDIDGVDVCNLFQFGFFGLEKRKQNIIFPVLHFCREF